MAEVLNQEYLACCYRIYSCCHVCYGSVLAVRWCQYAPQNILPHLPHYTVPQPRIFTVIPFVLVLWDLKSSVVLFDRTCCGTPNALEFYQVVKIQHFRTFEHSDFTTAGERIGRSGAVGGHEQEGIGKEE
jgi:hypothetical protein